MEAASLALILKMSATLGKRVAGYYRLKRHELTARIKFFPGSIAFRTFRRKTYFLAAVRSVWLLE